MTKNRAKATLGTSGRYQLGQRVRHEKFGEGVVLQVDGDGAQERVQINFANAGMKWLMLSYAKLDICSRTLIEQDCLLWDNIKVFRIEVPLVFG